MRKCDGHVHKLPLPSEREVMCETPLEISAVCNGQVKWSPEPMDKLHLFKYLFSHLFFDRLAGRKISRSLIQKDNILRRHLHVMGLSDSPLRRRCAAEDETFGLTQTCASGLLLGARGH